MAELRKFSFDTEFDAGGGVAFQAPRPKRAYTPEEVEEIRAEAFAEGQQAGLSSAAAEQARALAMISAACGQALPKLAELAHEHRVGSATLALACGRAIADAALERFPRAPLDAALDALAREIDSAPRLVVGASPQMAQGLQEALESAAQRIGYSGAVQVRTDMGQGACAFTLDFGDGSAAYDPELAAQRVTDALAAALAAEGLHAEPLIPGSGA
jgi:flagellar assembly protein FliH